MYYLILILLGSSGQLTVSHIPFEGKADCETAKTVIMSDIGSERHSVNCVYSGNFKW